MKCLNAGGKELLEKEDKNGNKWKEKKISPKWAREGLREC